MTTEKKKQIYIDPEYLDEYLKQPPLKYKPTTHDVIPPLPRCLSPVKVVKIEVIKVAAPERDASYE